MTAAIQTERLTKTFRSGWGEPHPAVSDLDLTVPAGSVFGLLGPNGAGKSTTIMMLLDVLRPTAGTYQLFGRPMRDIAVRAKVGYLPEKFQLPGHLRAREFLAFQGRYFGMSGPDLDRRIEQLLQLVGLSERSESLIAGFSKGMQQRLALAQALLNDPDLVILDEPTSALDPVGRRDVRVIVEGLRDRGKTVLLNSHILSDVERVCDSVAILRKGRLIRQGPTGTLGSNELEVVLRVGGWTPELEAAISGLGRSLHVTPGAIVEAKLYVPDEQALPRLAQAVQTQGASLYGMTPQRESLEELFMRTVGEA